MYRKYLNARSPLRLLEKGAPRRARQGEPRASSLAGHGVGKTAFLVGIALDDLLRGGHVLHVALDQTVGPRARASTTRCSRSSRRPRTSRTRRACTPRSTAAAASAPTRPASFSAAKLREAVKFEGEAGAKPELVIVEGFDVAQRPAGRARSSCARSRGELRRRDLALGVGPGRARRGDAPRRRRPRRGPAQRDPRARAGRRRRRAARAQGPREPGPLGAARGARPEDAAAQAELSAGRPRASEAEASGVRDGAHRPVTASARRHRTDEAPHDLPRAQRLPRRLPRGRARPGAARPSSSATSASAPTASVTSTTTARSSAWGASAAPRRPRRPTCPRS